MVINVSLNHRFYFMSIPFILCLTCYNVSFICQCNFTQSESCIDPLTVILSKFSGFHEYKFQSETISHAIGKISIVNLL